MTATIYTGGVSEYCNSLLKNGFTEHTLQEGLLGWGLTVFTKPNFKSVVVREKFINEWSSGHTIRKYNKLPKKYASAIEAVGGAVWA